MRGDEYDALEESFVALSGLAFKRAFEETLAAGYSATIVSDGVIVEVFPAGRRLPIASLLRKPRPVEIGARYILREPSYNRIGIDDAYNHRTFSRSMEQAEPR